LPLAVYQAVFRRVTAALAPAIDVEGPWRGHRTFLVDGSGFAMPDTAELRDHFGLPGGVRPGCGFPVAKLLALFHAGTGLILEVLAAPLRTHELAQVRQVHAHLKAGDVLVGDRAFCSFAHLALLTAGGLHAVVRVHQKRIVDFSPGRSHAPPRAASDGRPRSRWDRWLGPADQVVEWFKPRSRPPWLGEAQFAALPESLMVRELRYAIGRPGFRTRSVTLVTTLLEADAYPWEALADLYAMRWRVETHLRELKRTMKMDVLKCKTVDGVLKELTVYALVYNLVRAVMVEASHRQGTAVERISFVDALRWLAGAGEGEELPELVVNPSRPGRFEPRVVKRRPKAYMRMTRTRAAWRKRLLEQAVAA
jgi:hypothetical protein